MIPTGAKIRIVRLGVSITQDPKIGDCFTVFPPTAYGQETSAWMLMVPVDEGWSYEAVAVQGVAVTPPPYEPFSIPLMDVWEKVLVIPLDEDDPNGR